MNTFKLKYLLPLTVIALFISCEDTTEEQKQFETFTFTSENAKTFDNQYFAFATNMADTTEPASWDINFTGESFSPAPGAPVIFNPFISLGVNVSVAILADSTLADEPTVTSATVFESDTDSTKVIYDWYDMDEYHILYPKTNVYVVKTAAMDYYAFEIKDYYDNEGNSGVFTIDWVQLDY
jgi:hypothetical protein